MGFYFAEKNGTVQSIRRGAPQTKKEKGNSLWKKLFGAGTATAQPGAGRICRAGSQLAMGGAPGAVQAPPPQKEQRSIRKTNAGGTLAVLALAAVSFFGGLSVDDAASAAAATGGSAAGTMPGQSVSQLLPQGLPSGQTGTKGQSGGVSGTAAMPGASGIMVWLPTNGGIKYHNDPTCSDMIDPREATLEEAQQQGFAACQKCYG